MTQYYTKTEKKQDSQVQFVEEERLLCLQKILDASQFQWRR